MAMHPPVTRIQLSYLRLAESHGHFAFGWGGYKSTRTVRLLEERGLIRLGRNHCAAGADPLWCVVAITPKGEEVLARVAAMENR
jgi:hypothetical protein